ncbi:hypothetical protein Ais01nite_54560 [Asanoa ishikariensis]|uniref:ABC-type lipoprotein export system, ATPase component n=1 Tax=Asanoa ishikariensis TaxID=137265 RepID=A0A1H3TVI0_9ACTN|nr:hypothetical protein Ais01nite_54560 [Asanoa ishikariensis]SDZ53239.1 ABC-type lipoprotein export system, ATPase component [Asanoa ishikariensis]
MTTTAVTGPAARAVQVWKVYGAGETEVVALRDVSVDLERGKFTAIMGPSGSGKSTLMHCLAGLDSVSRGEVYVGGTKVTGLGDAGLTRLRRDKIGFIFQQFNLLPTLTAEENILLPLSIAGRKPDPEWYRTVIDTVRLGDRLGHRPSQLSGGQQQRVACARALVARPDVIFADEPTGNLDSRSGADVLGFLSESVRTHGQTIVMVTHDPVAASYADRVLFLADGAVVAEILEPTADAVLDRMRTIDEGPRGPGPAVGLPHESRGTTDPTGRTPHPGPPPVGGGPGGPPRMEGGTEPGGGTRDPSARVSDRPGSAQGFRLFAADNGPTATLTSTAPSTLTAAPQPTAPTQATPPTVGPVPQGPPAEPVPRTRRDPDGPTTPRRRRPAESEQDPAERPRRGTRAVGRAKPEPGSAAPAPGTAPSGPNARPAGAPEPSRTRPTDAAPPGQTSAEPPGQAGHAPPSQTGQATPGQTGQAPPGQTGQAAPGQTDQAAPGQTGQAAPPGQIAQVGQATPGQAVQGTTAQASVAGGDAEAAGVRAGIEVGERRTTTRRKAVQRPAATHPPKGRPTKGPSQPEQSAAETTDAPPEPGNVKPRKAAKRTAPRKTKPTADAGDDTESIVDEHS